MSDERVRVVRGPRGLPSACLRALLPALAEGRGVFWIDAGNSFDAYGLGRAARSAGLDARLALSRVRLSRPFHLHQLQALLSEHLPRAWRGEPVVLSDPLALLFDEGIGRREAAAAFDDILGSISRLKAAWLVVVVERPAPEGREGWARRLECAGAGN
jgi:hypothetical protein